MPWILNPVSSDLQMVVSLCMQDAQQRYQLSIGNIAYTRRPLAQLVQDALAAECLLSLLVAAKL